MIKSRRGASAIETALVLPVVLFLTILCIDFGRYYITRGVVEAAAQRALTYASVVPDLEDQTSDDLPGDPPNNDAETRSKQTMTKILNKVDQILTHSGIDTGELGDIEVFSDLPTDSDYIGKFYEPSCQRQPCMKKIELKIPKPDATQTLSTALLKTPIILDLTLQYNPILPFFGHFEVPVHTLAFREPRTTATLPLTKDCWGVIGGKGLGCTCPDNPAMVIGQFGCECKAPLVPGPDGKSCVCPGGGNEVYDPVANSCDCRPCDDTWERITGTCGCRCPKNRTNQGGSCLCLPPYKTIGQDCVCDTTQPCPYLSKRDPLTCQCKCQYNSYTMCNNACVPKCATGQHLDQNCKCVCDDPTKTACRGGCVACAGGRVEPNSCTCLCPEGKQVCQGMCRDCPCGKRLDGNCNCTENTNSGAVQCDNGACDSGKCYGDLIVDPRSPYCGTNYGWACTCPPDEPMYCETWDSNELCHPICPEGMYRVAGWDSDDPEDNCQCRCPAGQAQCDGECVDKNCSNGPIIGQEEDPNSCGCKCPADKSEICNNECREPCYYARNMTGTSIIPLTRDPTTCACKCPGTMIMTSRAGRGFNVNYCIEPCTDGKAAVPTNSSPYSGYTCACDASTPVSCNHTCVADTCAAQGKIHDPETCACVCPPDKPTTCGGNCYENCPNSELTRKEGSCDQCTCADNLHFCAGNPLGSQCVSPLCPGAESEFNEGTCKCECPSQTEMCANGAAVQCLPKCPTGMVRNSTCSECVCPSGQVECGTQNAGRGACYAACPAGQSRNEGSCDSCTCDTGQKCNDGRCLDCPSPLTLDARTCTCGCPGGDIYCRDNAQDSTAECKDAWSCSGIGQVRDLYCDSCKCRSGHWTCKSDPLTCVANCPSPRVKNFETCACDCPSDTIECRGACVRCRPDQTLNMGTCQCECTNSNATACTNSCTVLECQGNVAPDPVTCTCAKCPTGQNLCNNGTQCQACDAPYVVQSDCSCGCPDNTREETCKGNPQCITPCEAGRHWDSNLCTCVCDATEPEGGCGTGPVEFHEPTCQCRCIPPAVPNTDPAKNGSTTRLICLSPRPPDCRNCEVNDTGTGWIDYES